MTHPTDVRLYKLTIARIETEIEKRVIAAKTFRLSEEVRFSSIKSSDPSVTLEKMQGGLGNILFQLASAFGVAKTNSRVFTLKSNDLRLRYFVGLHVPTLSVQYDIALLPEKFCCKHSNEIQNLNLIYENKTVALSGYLQSWKYFNTYGVEIRNAFTFDFEVYQTALRAINNSLTANLWSDDLTHLGYWRSTRQFPVLVGMHVRRGDILQTLFQDYGHTASTDQYLLRATIYFQRKYEFVIFVVVSNDINYSRKVFVNQQNFVFINTTEASDMALMTLMDHMIISVGTYGFWSAYLGKPDRDILYFKHWPKNGSKLDLEFSHEDYFLPKW